MSGVSKQPFLIDPTNILLTVGTKGIPIENPPITLLKLNSADIAMNLISLVKTVFRNTNRKMKTMQNTAVYYFLKRNTINKLQISNAHMNLTSELNVQFCM